MDRLFLTVLNMSISASFCILAVLVVRLLLMWAPKWLSYLLWAVVFIRLVCPVLPEADFGLIPDIRLQENEQREVEHTYKSESAGEEEQNMSGENAYDNFAVGVDLNAEPGEMRATRKDEDVAIYNYPSEKITETSYRVPKLDKILAVIAWIWVLGVLGLILFAGVRYWTFLHNIEKKEVTTPFVAGILHPLIYLPEGLGQTQKQMVLEHENVHIRRLDYLVKPIAFLVCCVHWFNPLVWVFFLLMEKDMEASCDEAVLHKIGYDRRKDYANALLELSQGMGEGIGCPIAFGENNVKSRIKGVIKMKKAGIGVSIAAVAVLLAVAALLLVNRSAVEEPTDQAESAELEEDLQLPEENPQLPEENLQLSEETGMNSDDLSSEEKGTFSLPDIKEYLYFSSEDYSEEERTYIQSSENGGGETIMNYNPDRVRDQFEVLNLPQVDESFGDTEILFAHPVEADRISDSYGSRVHPVSGDVLFHLGVDFAAEAGTPVMAAADGTVVKTGFDTDCGNYIILLHENGSASYYFHCQDILTQEEKQVKSGEQIATVGNTGKSTGAHLHFGVSRNGEYVEPEFMEDMFPAHE